MHYIDVNTLYERRCSNVRNYFYKFMRLVLNIIKSKILSRTSIIGTPPLPLSNLKVKMTSTPYSGKEFSIIQI